MFTTSSSSPVKASRCSRAASCATRESNVCYYANDAFLAPACNRAGANKGKFAIVCCGDGGEGLANLRRSGELADVYAMNAAPSRCRAGAPWTS